MDLKVQPSIMNSSFPFNFSASYLFIIPIFSKKSIIIDKFIIDYQLLEISFMNDSFTIMNDNNFMSIKQKEDENEIKAINIERKENQINIERKENQINIERKEEFNIENKGENGSISPSLSPSIPFIFQSKDDYFGFLRLDIISAINLPMTRKYFRHHYKSNPFMIISFGKSSWRTRTIKKSLNPIWEESFTISLKKSDYRNQIIFSLYDYDRLGKNQCLASQSLRIDNFVEKEKEKEIKMGMNMKEGNEIINLALQLNIKSYNEYSYLLLKARFISFANQKRTILNELFNQIDNTTRFQIKREFSNRIENERNMKNDEMEERGKLIRNSKNNNYKESESGEKGDFQEIIEMLISQNIEMMMIFEKCPYCKRDFIKSSVLIDEFDIIKHLSTHSRFDSIVCLKKNDLLTEEYASRKTIIRILRYLGFGGYNLGKNNANIFVQDRETGKVIEEKIPFYVRFGIRLIFQIGLAKTPQTSFNIKLLKRIFHRLTVKQGVKFSDPQSKKYISGFIQYYGINVDEVYEPKEGFSCFNEFFYRKKKKFLLESKKLAILNERQTSQSFPFSIFSSFNSNASFSSIRSPADCRITCYESIHEAMTFWIKGSNFSISSLLGDDLIAKEFVGGSMAICRLAPQDYHRFHSPIDGYIDDIYYIPGSYYTVNPMAIRQKIDVFTENVRMVCLINSQINPPHGNIAMIPIGAMMVGSIVITAIKGKINILDEIGYFAYGGSTIILLFRKDSIKFDSDLLNNSKEQLETLIRVGDSIGQNIYS